MFKAMTVCLTAGALALVACSDGGDDEVAAFCDEVDAFAEKHGGGGPVVTDDLQVDEEWLKAREAIEPTEEIADEWATVNADYKTYGDTLAELDLEELQTQAEGLESAEDLSSLEGAGSLMAEASQAMAVLQTDEHVDAENKINAYISDNC